MGGLRGAEYGEPDAYGHRKKANVGELLAEEIKRRADEETIVSDLTYDLRSGDPDFIDKLVASDLQQHGIRCHPSRQERAHVGHGRGLLSIWRRFPIPSSGRARWTSRPCTTPNAIVPITRNKLGLTDLFKPRL